MKSVPTDKLASLPISRDRTQFMLELLRDLIGTIEGVVGREDADGFISIVGARVGQVMNREYRELLETDRLDLEHVAAALVDLKRRIDGGFSIESISDKQITLINSRCPFGGYVKGRSSLCMMTSNVFGRIASENLGYAKVTID